MNLAIIFYNLSEKNLDKIKTTTIVLVDVLDTKKQIFKILIVANFIVDDFVSENFFKKISQKLIFI